MKNLSSAVKSKAVEIGNALLDAKNKMGEGRVIATAISRAKDWAANRGKKISAKGKNSRSTDVKKHGEDRYVIPYNEKEWAIKTEGAQRVSRVFRTKKEAVKKARTEARKAHATLTIQKRTGRVQQRISYNPRKG